MSSVRTFAGIFMALALWCGTAVAQNDVEFDASVESLEAVGNVNVSDVPAPSSDSSEDSSSSAYEGSSEDAENSENNSSEASPPEPVCIPKTDSTGTLSCENGKGCKSKPLDKKKCVAVEIDKGPECICRAEDRTRWTCAERIEVLGADENSCSGTCIYKSRPGKCIVNTPQCICLPDDASCSEKPDLGLVCGGTCTTGANKPGTCSTINGKCDCKELPPPPPDKDKLSCAEKIKNGFKCEGKCRTSDGKDGGCDGDSQSCVCKQGIWNGVGDKIKDDVIKEGVKNLNPFRWGRRSELPSDSDGFDGELPGEEEGAIDPGDDSPNEPGDDSPIDQAAE